MYIEDRTHLLHELNVDQDNINSKLMQYIRYIYTIRGQSANIHIYMVYTLFF